MPHLESLTEAVLDFSSVDDLRQWLDAHSPAAPDAPTPPFIYIEQHTRRAAAHAGMLSVHPHATSPYALRMPCLCHICNDEAPQHIAHKPLL